ALAGHVAGTIIGARGAVGTPAHEARRYRQRYAAGDIIVVVDAGERRQDAQRMLVHRSVGRGHSPWLKPAGFWRVRGKRRPSSCGLGAARVVVLTLVTLWAEPAVTGHCYCGLASSGSARPMMVRRYTCCTLHYGAPRATRSQQAGDRGEHMAMVNKL